MRRFALLFSLLLLGGDSVALAKDKRTFTTVASWYGEDFHQRKMANGDRFNMYDPTTVAHRSLPFGTRLQVTNPENGKTMVVTVTDRGPFVGGRGLDLSMAGAWYLGFLDDGTQSLFVRVLN